MAEDNGGWLEGVLKALAIRLDVRRDLGRPDVEAFG